MTHPGLKKNPLMSMRLSTANLTGKPAAGAGS